MECKASEAGRDRTLKTCSDLSFEEQTDKGMKPYCPGVGTLDAVDPFPDSLIAWHSTTDVIQNVVTQNYHVQNISLTEFYGTVDGAAEVLQGVYQEYQILESKIMLDFFFGDNTQYRVQIGPRQAGQGQLTDAEASRSKFWTDQPFSRYTPVTRASNAVTMSELVGYDVTDVGRYIVDPPSAAAKMYVWQVIINNVNSDANSDMFYMLIKIFYKVKWTRPYFNYGQEDDPAKKCYIDGVLVTEADMKHYQRMNSEEREAAREALKHTARVSETVLRPPSVSAMSVTSTRSVIKK